MPNPPGSALLFFIKRIRIIPQLETYPIVVRFAQTLLGQICLIAACTFILFKLTSGIWLEAGVASLIAAIFKIKNRLVVLIGLGLYLSLLRPLAYIVDIPNIKYILLHLSYMQNWIFLKEFANNFSLLYSCLASFAVIIFSVVLTYFIVKNKVLIIRSWPISSLLVADFLLIILGLILPKGHSFTYIFWVLLVLFNTTYWSNFCYTLLHKEKLKNKSWLYWLGPGVIFSFPFGKSNVYLEQREATNSFDLAKTQIKALKLLLWLWLLRHILIYVGPLIGIPGYTIPFIPNINVSNISVHFENFLNHTPSSTGIIWLSLFITYFYDLLIWTLKFNVPVAVIRMLGFYIPRGLYKPLYAKSIPDYFSRRYYYYKELIFDFFVLPLFMHLRRIKDRRTRTFWAIFIGVAFGSMLTHTTGSIADLYNVSLGHYLERSFPFYLRCIGFGLLIAVFQFGNPIPVDGMRFARLRHFINVVIIVVIFSLAKVFTPMMQTDNPTDAFRFFLSLFTF